MCKVWGAWMALLVEHPTLEFGSIHDLLVMGLSLVLSFVLTAWGLLGIHSLPLSLPLPCSLSFSKWINIFKKCKRTHFFLRERVRECKQERGAEEDPKNPKQTSCLVQSLMQGSIPWTWRSWPEPKSIVGGSPDWATQAPQSIFCNRQIGAIINTQWEH